MKTVRKALAILDSFTKDNQAQGVTDIARRLELHKSTVHGILKALTAENYLIFDHGTRKYALGFKLLELGGRITYGRDLRDIALPVMQKLSQICDEDTTLNIRIEGHRVCTAIAESQSFVRHIIPIGKALPLHCSAAGKVLLAYLEPQEIGAIIDTYGLKRFTANTITNKKRLLAELEAVKSNGYGQSRNEYGKDAAALAFPVFNGHGTVVAALSIQTTISRLNEASQGRFVAEGIKASREISRFLPEALAGC